MMMKLSQNVNMDPLLINPPLDKACRHLYDHYLINPVTKPPKAPP